MDDSWTKRREVTIDNSLVSSALVNYQIKLTVAFSSSMKSDFSDLRFTSSDGATLIPFWVESYVASSSAVVWVNVPYIPASGTATVYMYYGNPSASSASDARSTFDFFEDFETEYSSGSGWTDRALLPEEKADPTAAVFDDQLYVFGGYDNNGAKIIMKSVYAYDPVLNDWTQKADVPTARWGSIAVQYGGKIYVFSGFSSGVEKYVGNPLAIPQYGADSALHPDVIYFPGGKDGYEYWMMYTPYQTGYETDYENPCVVRSHDGITWTDAEISNPIIPGGVPPGDLENPDPDFVYVSDYDKWFMVWCPGDVANDSRKLALAYSSDGKTWTQYDGDAVNGNANPIILSGTDTYGQAWECEGEGEDAVSKTCTPTLLYEGGVFYLYYSEEASGTNRGKLGLATFTWNAATHSVENLARANDGNPIIDLPQGSSYLSGIGHIDVAKAPTGSGYFMYGVREALVGAVRFQVVLLSSSDRVSWVSTGTVLTPGAPGEWDGARVYRSCPTVYETGQIALFDGTIKLFYTGELDPGPICKIGIAHTPSTGIPSSNGIPTSVNEIYDPTSNTWAVGADAPVELAGQGLMGVSYGNVIHLFYHQYHYTYDPVTEAYTRKADVPTYRTWGTCAVVNDKIYVIGGYYYDASGNPIAPSNVNQVYDPATDTWDTKAPIPESIYGVTRENPVIGGKIYVTHGLNTVFHTTNYIYDPSDDSWSSGSSASHARDGVACGVISDKLYVVGGRNIPTNPYGLNYNEEYDPAQDEGGEGTSPWYISDPTRVYFDASAAHDGSYGLLINDDSPSSSPYAEHTYSESNKVVEFDWDMTDALGIETLQPQGRILLVPESSLATGTLYFFNDAGTPQFEWYNGAFTVLQSASWNTWYHISIVQAGASSQVIINDVAHSVTSTAAGSDRVRLQTSITKLSRAFYDNVRVRKYAPYEPPVSIGDEESTGYEVTFAQTGSGAAPKVTYQIDSESAVQNTVPFSVNVDDGSSISYSYESTVAGTTGTQYVFTGVDPDSPQTITAPLTITGSYKTQYYLTVNDGGHGTAGGEGWYDADTVAQATLTPLTVPGTTGTQYVFAGWTGDASGSGSPSNDILMDAPKTATASWTTQYYLTVSSAHGSTSGEGWYDSGATAYAGLAAGTVSGGTDIQYVFSSWGTDASGTNYASSDAITMDAPKTASASWITQFWITVDNGGHGSPTQASQWVDQGASFSTSVASPADVVPDVSQWVTAEPTLSIADVQAAQTLTFVWTQQFWIAVDSNGHGSPTEVSQWVDAGGSFTVSVTDPDVVDSGHRWSLAGLTLDSVPQTLSNSLTLSDVQAAHSIVFSWAEQWYLTVVSSYGTAAGEGWYDSGSLVTVSVSSPVTEGSFIWTCTGWSGTGSVPLSGSEASVTFTILEASAVTWNWQSTPTSEARFDFGTVDSPVEAGYTQVTNVTLYSPSVGYGWSSSDNLWTRDRGAPDSLRRDFVVGNLTGGSTFNVDLPNGVYLVTLVMGDQGYVHDNVDVYAEGTLVVNDLTSQAGSFQETSFKVTVADGQLNLRFVDDGGVDPNWVVNALTVVVAPPLPTEAAFDFGTSGSPVQSGYIQVSTSTAYSVASGYGWTSTAGLDSRDRGAPDDLRRDLVFSAAEHTFNVDLANGEYMVTITLGDQSFMHDQINVYAENTLVINHLTVVPGSFQEVSFRITVTDEQLNLVIQDDGGVDPYWVLTALAVQPAPALPTEASFDFGMLGSPVEAGYTQVTTSTAYSALYGYGWSSTAGLDSRDRGSPDDLREDLVFSATEHTFNVDLANGEYLVAVTIGDQSFMHDQISVYAEDVLVVDHLTVQAGSFQAVSFRVVVTDEQLNLRILDDGGVDPYWVLNALTVQVAPPLPTEASFDFGTASSPVEAGYTQVTTSTVYSAITGYGWTSTAGLDSRDRGAPDDLRSDFVFSSTEHTFSVDLANGDYTVTVVIGDQYFMHDNIDVYAQGALAVNDLTAQVGTLQEVSFGVTVIDGQLSLVIRDDGGTDPNWVLNALTIQAV